jgi:hypothetical protein
MRDSTDKIRRELKCLLKKQRATPQGQTFLGSSRGFAFVTCRLPYEQLTETERAQLAAEQQQHECEHDPPDAIERLLAREIAKLKGEPDPYGCDGLSEAECRARDWADYHEKERIS